MGTTERNDRDVMKHAARRILHTGREYLTHWMVAGLIVAATGAAPDHWIADLMHDLHIPADALHLWAAEIDLRWVLLCAGLTLVVGDIVWRRTRATTVATPIAATGGLVLPNKPSIAVLAFTNMSGDPDQEYFSDGIAEDITTALSHVSWLFVIARNSSFTYKGRAVDLKQVGHELGVRYVLEGSVRRAGNNLRITGQLIEAETGTHVWAERYDRTLDDIFAIQDEISRAVVSSIEPVLAASERDRVRRMAPDKLDTWELYHRGMWHFCRLTYDDYVAAKKFLGDAERLDPRSAPVQAGLALCSLVGG